MKKKIDKNKSDWIGLVWLKFANAGWCSLPTQLVPRTPSPLPRIKPHKEKTTENVNNKSEMRAWPGRNRGECDGTGEFGGEGRYRKPQKKGGMSCVWPPAKAWCWEWARRTIGWRSPGPSGWCIHMRGFNWLSGKCCILAERLWEVIQSTFGLRHPESDLSTPSGPAGSAVSLGLCCCH